jgi:hypothetical protein
MKERVSLIVGKLPIILVAPHGSDDTNTDILTEMVAKKTNSYAVINRGFERADIVDVNKDKADCNRINHCKEDVVYEEFLKPIIKFKNQIIGRSLFINKSRSAPFSGKYAVPDPVTLFFIHGCGDVVHKEAGERVSLIIGYGRGTKKDSFSCDLWRKNLFIDFYRHFNKDEEVFEGRGGGRYAGRDSNNLNQYFRKHDLDWNIHSMQLEFPFSSRNCLENLTATAEVLTDTIKKYQTFEDYKIEPVSKFI